MGIALLVWLVLLYLSCNSSQGGRKSHSRHPAPSRLYNEGIGSFGGHFFELRRACEVEGGMAPDGIVEPVDVAADGLVGFLTGVEDGPPDELGFQLRRRTGSTAALR